MKHLNTTTAATAFINTDNEGVDSHKLDVAIWEFMADYKKRTIQQIAEGMCFLGFQGKTVDRHMKKLFARKWFDRHGERGATVTYVLKKHVKHPGGKVQPEPSALEVLLATAPMLPVYDFSNFTVQPDVIDEMAQGALAMPELVIEAVPAMPQYVVEKTDPVRVAIWKTMADQGTYLMADLLTLLDHVARSTLTYHLRQMELDGMFDVIVVAKNGTKAYALKDGVPMPQGLPAYEPNYR